MARPYTPRDYAVGNNMLPILQLIAKNDRAVRTALAGQAPPPPAAQAPAPDQLPPPTAAQPDFAPIFTKMPAAQPQAQITRRQTTPLPASAPQEAAPRPAPAAQGLGEMLSGLSPDERNMMRQSMLAGAAGGLSDVLSRRPNAGFGEMLLGAGAGGLSGQLAGRQGVRAERRGALGERLAEAQLTTAQADAQRKQQEAQRIQTMLADPNTPPEMKQALEMSLAGLSGGAIQAVLPQQMSPYEQKSLELRERQIDRMGQMTPYQQASLEIQRERLASGAGGGRPQIFGSGEAGYYTLGPDNKPQQLVAPVASTSGGGSGTALMRNVPFIAERMGISEGDATKLLLSSASGRKTPEQIKLDLVEKLVSTPRYMSDPTGAVRGAEDIMQMLEGGEAAAPPMVTEAPTEGWGDYIAGFLPDFMGEEEAATATAAPAAEASEASEALAPPANLAIESMGLEDLEALDPASLSEEDRLRAADRWDVLNGG